MQHFTSRKVTTFLFIVFDVLDRLLIVLLLLG